MAVSGMPPAGRAKRGPGCLTWGLTLVVAVAVLCCVGAAGGVGAGWFTSQPGEPARVPVPDGFPVAAYLPQVAVAEVAAAMEALGYECEIHGDASGRRVTDAAHVLSCLPTEAVDLTGSRGGITAEHDDDAGTRGVTVVCRPQDDQPENCRQLFLHAVDGVLVGHPERESAAGWVEESLSATDVTGTLGDLELTIRHFGRQSELRIWAA